MDEPLLRVTPLDEPPLAGLLAEVPLIEVPLVPAAVGLALLVAPPAWGEPAAAWVWWCSGVVVPVEVLC